MSFELNSFSPEFFFNEGEPYDYNPEPSEKPTSVWHAICSCKELDPKKWAHIALEVFNMKDPSLLTEESVLDKIRETDTCSNLTVPVEVWIDAEGWLVLQVWDSR